MHYIELDWAAKGSLQSNADQAVPSSSLREPCITTRLEFLVSGGGTDVEVV